MTIHILNKHRSVDAACGQLHRPHRGQHRIGRATSAAEFDAFLECGILAHGFLRRCDPFAAGLPIVSLGIERDGFHNGRLAIAASMATDEEGWAGIYVTQVPEPSSYALVLLALGVAGGVSRRRRAG